MDHIIEAKSNTPGLTDLPSVSIVLPTLNERSYIRDCLDSLVAQDYPAIVEILVCDGGSTDGTREIVQSLGGRVRLVDNPGVTAAGGLNVGLAEMSAEIYCRGDAHSLYASDYVSRCVDTLRTSGADNVGGPMRAVGGTAFGRAVAAITSTPFGIGPGRFHYATEVDEVDTVYLGCWWKSTLTSLGGWDQDRLQWGAEDHELNMRIRQRGGRIVLDPGIRSWYFPREDPRRLARQYHNYGIGKASTLAKHRDLPSWRPLAPALLVAGSIALATITRGPSRLALPGVHAVACAAVAVAEGREDGVAPHRALAAVEICHWSYGFGFWRGLMRFALRRRFDNQPSGHR